MFDFDFTHQQRETVDYFIESGEFASQDEVVCAGLQLLCENYMPQLADEKPSKIIAQFVATDQFAGQDEVIHASFRLLCENHISRLIEEARNSPIIENWTAESFLAEMKQEMMQGKGQQYRPEIGSVRPMPPSAP